MKVRSAVAGLLLAVAVQLGAATRVEQIDALLTKANELRQFNGTALVADESGVVFRKGYGYANFEWQIPNTPDVRFRLGSITKQFTSMVVMQLVSEGKIRLDGKLTDYLPDYRKDTGDRVTITHLLNHTSGIPSYTSLPGFFANESRNPYAPAEFIKKFASGDLQFEPGSKYAYNNSGYYLLGAIIEKVTGKPYADVLQERIFTPLGMKATGYDLARPIIPKRASGYQLAGGTYVNAPYLDMTIPFAAGSLYSTVDDLYLWERALYTDRLLPADLKKQLYTPSPVRDYGFGWAVGKKTLDDGKSEVFTIGHDGGINGFNTVLLRVPEKKELVVLLDNTSRGDKLDGLALSLLSILHGITPKQPLKSAADELQSLTSGADIVAKYRELRKTRASEFEFAESDLNNLGYTLLRQGRVDDAIQVFQLNVELYPQSGNPYDSLGEAYAVKGNKELALKNYRRSVELDPKNQNGIDAIARLEKPADTTTYPLEAFVGRYQLAPAFILSFFIENGQLVSQATGQPKVALRPLSSNEFAAVGVAARLVFEMEGPRAKSLTLIQNGREMKAKRID